MLLDEITSALDVEQIAKILIYLKNLRGKNIGIFIITHLLGFARHAADQVLFMANGEDCRKRRCHYTKKSKNRTVISIFIGY